MSVCLRQPNEQKRALIYKREEHLKMNRRRKGWLDVGIRETGFKCNRDEKRGKKEKEKKKKVWKFFLFNDSVFCRLR